MYQQHTIAFQNQMPLRPSRRTRSTLGQVDGLLGNRDAQRPSEIKLESTLRAPIFTQPSRLEILKRDRFRSVTKDERVARSLAALNQPASIALTADEWKSIAEDPDIEDQF